MIGGARFGGARTLLWAAVSSAGCGGMAADGGIPSGAGGSESAVANDGGGRPRRPMTTTGGSGAALEPPVAVAPQPVGGSGVSSVIGTAGTASLPPDPPSVILPTSASEAANPCNAPLALKGHWANEAARVSLMFDASGSTIRFSTSESMVPRDPRTGAPSAGFWALGVDECCPDPTSDDDDWRWPLGIDPPERCAQVPTFATDSCGSAGEGSLPIDGQSYQLEEVCLGPGVDDASGTARRAFQFRPTDAWAEFCQGAESVRCADVVEQTGGDFCEADYICNYRYEELDQIMDFCAWYLVCSCDAVSCNTNTRMAWRYTIESTASSSDLYVRISFIDTITGSVTLESIGFSLQQPDLPPLGLR
jgi:hypothetical protein